MKRTTTSLATLATTLLTWHAATPQQAHQEPQSQLFGVSVQIEERYGPIELETAEKVKRDLERHRPENPGRIRSFHKLRTPNGVNLERTGWSIVIQRAVPTKTGWRALVWVYPQLRTRDNHRTFATPNHHIEGYRLDGDKLTLIGEMVDPLEDPEEGIGGIMFGGGK